MRPLWLLFFFAASLSAQTSEYQTIRDARPDGRVIPVTNLTIERDAFRFDFKSGSFHLLAPFGEQTFGAVFVGDATYTLTPATPNERQHLRIVRRDQKMESFTDRFDTALFLFTDQTFQELSKHVAASKQQPDARANAAFDDYFKLQKTKFELNLHLRLLMDFLNRPSRTDGVFAAMIDSPKESPLLLVLDPLGIGNLAAKYGFFGGEEVAVYSVDDNDGGFWYLSARKSEAKPGVGKPLVPIVDAEHYAIDTTIDGTRIEGTTKMRVKALSDGVRVVPIHLHPKLRISEAKWEGKSLALVQEEMAYGKFARLFRGEASDGDAAVVLPQPLEKGKPAEIEIIYAGPDILMSVGADAFWIRERESWYPNVGTFTDLATYDLLFHHGGRYDVVAVGKRGDQVADDKRKTTHWKSDIPIRVAGFNYGKFVPEVRKDEVSGVNVTVYTQREWQKKAGDSAIDAVNASRVATLFFGKPPFTEISVTQQVEWSYGQAWPSLVYLPTVALTTGAERALMIDSPGLWDWNQFVKTVGWHEMAHQWWGHLVGWQSYRDQWLSEGFAEFTAALVLNQTEGFLAYDKYWEQHRKDIFTKRAAVSNNDAGPITQGFRLATRHAPGASQAVVYGKGAYVLHMLRMMMRDPTQKNSDEAFMRMMKDFVATYRDRNPSTADFQRMVEKHMLPTMNAAGNNRMDWFFDQWVRGTDVPKLRSTLKVGPGSAGKYRVSGTLAAEGVPATFLTIMPIYLDFGKDELGRIGFVRLVGTTPQEINAEIATPAPPKRVVANALHDVLVRD